MRKDIDAHEHDGFAVDLSIAETLAALESPKAIIAVSPVMIGSSASVSYRLCIVFRDEWFEICRTSLKDHGVVSINSNVPMSDVDEELAFWRRNVRYGARIKRYAHLILPILAIVDDWYDG